MHGKKDQITKEVEQVNLDVKTHNSRETTLFQKKCRETDYFEVAEKLTKAKEH